MDRASRLPIALLIAQMLLVCGYLLLTSRLVPREQPDTATYVDAPLNSAPAVLGGFRMPAYPALLAAVRKVSPDYYAIPTLQFFAFCGAVVALYAGLASLGHSRVAASLIAGSLLTCNMLQNYGRDILSDALAAALGAAAVGLTLLTVGRQGRWWCLLLVGLVTTAAWLTRPSYLFLVVLVPLLGALTAQRRPLTTELALIRVPPLRMFGRLLVAVLVPVIVWCGLRTWLLGRMDVTSTGGLYLIGIAGQLLDPPLVEKLPEDVRPRAAAVLERRARLPAGALVMTDASPLSCARLEANYAVTVEYATQAVADASEKTSSGQVELDVRRLAFEIIKRRPAAYGLYLCKAAGVGLSRAFGEPLLTPLGLLLTVLTLAATLLSAMRMWNPARAASDGGSREAVGLMFVAATLYFALAMASIMVACPPISRMTDGAAVLLPTVLMAVLIDRVVTLRGPRTVAVSIPQKAANVGRADQQARVTDPSR